MGSCNTKNGNSVSQSYLLQTLEGHEAGINCMSLSEDGSVIATGSEDKTARLWATKSDVCECIGVLSGHEGYISCICFEDIYVLTGSSDKSLRKWDISTCECLFVYTGHGSVVNRVICTGDYIFSSSYDRTACCWDFETGECVRVFKGHRRGVYPMIFIPAEDDDVPPDQWDWEGSKDILVTGSADFTAKSWSFVTAKCLQTFKGHTGAITCMATDAAGRTLFTGSTDSTVRSWSIVKGEVLKTFEGHTNSVICLQIVNKIMYTGSSDHTGRSWVTEFGDSTRVYKGHKHTISCLRCHDGTVYTGSGDGVARAFDAKSGTLKRSFKGHAFAVQCLQVVDKRLFTGSYDSTFRVWDIKGMKDETTFGKDEENKKDKEAAEIENADAAYPSTKIMIDDNEPVMNGNGFHDDDHFKGIAGLDTDVEANGHSNGHSKGHSNGHSNGFWNGLGAVEDPVAPESYSVHADDETKVVKKKKKKKKKEK